MTTQFRRLFSPVKLGRREAKNRIVSTPHGAAFGEKGGITDRYIRYHEEKAKGGCGVVMMFGSSSIHPTSVNDWGEVNNWDDSIIPQFRQMSDAIHRHGALCLSQISHRGRRGHSWYSGVPLWAPSDTREERHREWPHVMTKREIREVDRRLVRRRRAAPEGRLRRLRHPLLRRPPPRELPLPSDQPAHGRVRGLGRKPLPSHRRGAPGGPRCRRARLHHRRPPQRRPLRAGRARAGRSSSRSPAWSTASASPTTGW